MLGRPTPSYPRRNYPEAALRWSVERILEAVADHFGYEPPPWTAGRRSDDAS